MISVLASALCRPGQVSAHLESSCAVVGVSAALVDVFSTVVSLPARLTAAGTSDVITVGSGQLATGAGGGAVLAVRGSTAACRECVATLIKLRLLTLLNYKYI